MRRKWRGIGAQRKNHGHLQSFREARCKLPFKFPTARKLRGLPLRVLVAISNNGVLLSNRLKLIIFDSACHRCLSNGLCWRKVTFWLFMSFIYILPVSLFTHIYSDLFLENREITASSKDYATLQMNAILRTDDWSAFHRSPGVLGQEVSNVSQLINKLVKFTNLRPFIFIVNGSWKRKEKETKLKALKYF